VPEGQLLAAAGGDYVGLAAVGYFKGELSWLGGLTGATRDLVVVAAVRNDGAAAAEVDLYSLQNAHTGGEGHADGESVTASGDGILETRGTDRSFGDLFGAAGALGGSLGPLAGQISGIGDNGVYKITLVAVPAIGIVWITNALVMQGNHIEPVIKNR